MSSPILRLPRLAPRQTAYWLTVLRRTFRGSIFTYFLMPFLYLTAMGVGLGSFVDSRASSSALGGVSYLAFIAPGLLATTAMQAAMFESTYPVLSGFKWQRVYYSMAATPLEPTDIVFGQIAFVALRVFIACGVFLVVMAAYGALASPLGAVLALGVVVVVGLAHAAPVVGISARLNKDSGFSLIFRLGMMPMFLFSGAFFPISQLGDLAWIAYLTPIWHGVNLSRMLTTGQVEPGLAMLDLAYLLLFVVIGWFYAVTGFRKRLSQ